MEAMINTAEHLLAAAAPLPHAARLRLTAVTARRLADRGELAPLLTALDALGPYERRLAALAALTGADVPYLSRRLADPDPVVRRYALRGARWLPVPDETIEAAHDDAPAAVRADLARLLGDGRRTALTERLVHRLRAEYGDRDAARLLPGCSAEFTARMLPELAAAIPFEGWGRLAARHSLAVLDLAERDLADLPSRWHQTWWVRHATGIAAALPAAPERVIGLLERHGPDQLPGPVHDRLDILVSADAERITRWLADPDRSAPRWERTPGRRVLRRLVAANPPSLPRLGARFYHRGAFTTLLAATPPSGRLAFAEAVVALDPTGRSWLHDAVLALLPADQRHAQAAARIEAGRAEGAQPWEHWSALALLPPDRARPELLAALDTGDADDRETLWQALVANAGHSGDATTVAEILVLASARLRNEREPVRFNALDALRDLPGGLLAAALATGSGASGEAGTEGPLERLCLDGLRARDCSPRTRWVIRDLALGLLARPGTEDGAYVRRTAVRLIEALTAHTGTLDLGALGALGSGPHRRTAGVVLEALLPWLDRAADRGDFGPLLAAAAALGRRGHHIPALQERLARALGSCPDPDFGGLAALWLGDPATRGERVAELLAREPSAAFVAPVLAVLAAERTDLLDGALGAVPPGSRFPEPGAARPLPAFRYADRWLPRQQEAVVRLVRDALADGARSLDERAALLRAAAAVPRYGSALVRAYLPSDRGPDADAEPVFARAALESAATLDDPAEALAALLGHAGTDGAGPAWAAAGRVADRVRPSRLAVLFGDLLTRESGVKVAVRRSAARLAARYLPAGAAAELLAGVARDPRAHPDVRAAVAGLAPSLLPDPRMWELLGAAVAEGPAAARRVVLDRTPPDLAPAHRARYGALVGRLALVTDTEVAGAALYAVRDWARYAPAAVTLLGDLCADLSAPEDVARRARYGLCDLAGSDLPHPVGGAEEGSVLHGVVARLLGAVTAGEPEGAAGPAGRDLPARRRLEAVVESTSLPAPLCGALARQLAGVPALITLRASLLVRALELDAPEPELSAALLELARVADGRPVLAGQLAEELHDRHRYGRPLDDPAPAFAAVAALGDGLAEGLFAVGLASALGPRHGWPEPCREAVLGLRRHPEPEVRDAAYAVEVGAS